MKKVKKLKFLIGFYHCALVFILFSVIAMPLMIQHGIPVTREFIIEEGTLTTILIIILLGISYYILKGFKHTLKAHEREVYRAGEERSSLVSRLTEAFNYIGTVNVELQAVQSFLCGIEHYPQTRREFKRLIDYLTAKAMIVAGTPWIVIRLMGRCSGRTIKECTAERQKGFLPSVVMGNREILEDRHVEGRRTISSRQKNLDLLTVCILPAIPLPKEKIILIMAITNQVEMFFLLYRTGFLHQPSFIDPAEKGVCHDAHC